MILHFTNDVPKYIDEYEDDDLTLEEKYDKAYYDIEYNYDFIQEQLSYLDTYCVIVGSQWTWQQGSSGFLITETENMLESFLKDDCNVTLTFNTDTSYGTIDYSSHDIYGTTYKVFLIPDNMLEEYDIYDAYELIYENRFLKWLDKRVEDTK